MKSQLLLCLLIGAGISSAVWWLLDGVAPASGWDGQLQANLRLEDALQCIQEELAELASSRQSQVKVRQLATRAPALEAAEGNLDVRLESLEAAVARVESRIAELAIDAQHPPPEVQRNQHAVVTIVADYRSDQDAVRRRFFTWSPALIYQKYGMPDSSYTSGAQTVTWEYFAEREGEWGIKFDFVGGIVQNVAPSTRVRRK